jgi:capsular exopolysaccharide synthesis family protein
MREETQAPGLDLRDVIRVLRRRVPVLLIAVIATPAAAVGVSMIQEDQYTAEATLLLRDPQFDQMLFAPGGLSPSSDAEREAATNVELVSLDVVAAGAAEELGREFTRESIRDAIEISGEGEADVISISATAADPDLAAEIANVFASEYIDFRRRADQEMIRETTDLIERRLAALSPSDLEGATGRVLQRRLEELEILASLQTGNVEQVQVAEPPLSRSSPQPVRNGMVGAVLGVILGVGLALLLDRLDRRLREPQEVTDVFDRPALGFVPASDALADASRALPPPVAEAFRMLRANLRYFNIDSDLRSVIVTSPQPGDGKTTVAWNLAKALAAAGSRTLLVDADLRRPTLNRWAQTKSRLGLSELVSNQGSFDEAIIRSGASDTEGAGSRHELHVILAGSLPPNPDELMESTQMLDFLRIAEDKYDLVLIDTPPTSVVSDAIPLIREASGVLVVSRLGHTTRDAARQLAERLRNLEARVLGVVVNNLRAHRSGYGYEYGYYSPSEEQGSNGAGSNRRFEVSASDVSDQQRVG